MRDRWSDEGAAAAVERWGPTVGRELALRTYSSRLIGSDPELVLHGGGNTSVKAEFVDVLGDRREALYVKGSGWDLGSLEPQGLTPVDLPWIRRLRALPSLSDEDMVDALRTRTLRAGAPDPSIETLLHAFLPHRYVDHSHADAVVALTNRPDGEAHVREALGDQIPILPYVKPGFDLSKLAAALHDERPGAPGMVLLWHGLFTWGDSAEEAYRRHVDLVDRAERYLDARSRRVTLPVASGAGVERLLPALRGALGGGRGPILRFRVVPEAADPALADRVARGPLTPDHVIRTRLRPLVLDLDPAAPDLRGRMDQAVRAWEEADERTFRAHSVEGVHVRLEPRPRVIWLAGRGVVGAGPTAREADAAADIAEHTLRSVIRGDALGPTAPLPDERLFEMEYWSLEQRKLGRSPAPELGRRVALVTGAAGAIGLGVARQLLAAGAHVVITDRDGPALERARAALAGGGRVATALLDVTDPASVEAGFRSATLAFGGVDLVVVNAGIAVAGRLEDLADADLERATAVNFHGAQRTLRAAARGFRAQGLGGDVVVISSKNVAAPGAAFGAYSATKAAAHQLARVAALELAPLGVRVNLVAPDAVFAEGGVPSGLWAEIGPERARARGLAPEELPAFYRERNLLKAEVTGAHVGHAVVFLASGRTPTTGAVLPVDGGLPEAFPR